MAATVLTPAQLAERWSVSVRTVQRLCETHQIAAFRVGEQWRIPLAVVEAYEAETQAETQTPETPRPSSAPTREEAAPAYIPVVAGVVPWRSAVIEAPAGAGRGRATGKRKTASVNG